MYTLLAFAFFGASFLFALMPRGEGESQLFLYLNFLVPIFGFAVVLSWYFSRTDGGIKGFLREQNCSPKYYLLALTMQLGLLSLGELNGLFLRFLGRFGYEDTPILLPSTKGFGFVGVMLTVAVLPALFEECFFRGVLQREMKGFSLWAQLLLCGAFFALYHQNPAQTLYQLACGVGFALVAVKAGSFLPTVLSHFVNNGLVILLYALGIEGYPTPVYITLLVAGGLSLVGTVVYLLFLDKEEREQEEKGSYRQLFACAGVGIFVFALSWLATFFAGL